MHVDGLRCSVRGFSPTECGMSFRYHVHVQYGTAKWEIHKRFSDFDALLQTLQDAKFAALPSLPSKTIIGAPLDSETVSQRQRQLEIILHSLLSRPDTRMSQAVRAFMGFDVHTDVSTKKLQPSLVRSMSDLRFAVSGFCYCVEDNMIVIAQEDASHLSRLGRVWSVVESDELGSLNIWCKKTDTTWKREYNETFSLKVRCVSYAKKTRRIYVGMEDGTIRIYQRDEKDNKFKVIGVLNLHHSAPVTHLFCDDDRLMSLGYDTAMRIVSLADQQVISGGRLAKRLNDAYLTCGILHENYAVLGTSNDDIFVFSINGNPPQYRSQCKVVSGGPINDMVIFKEQLMVAHGDRISLYSPPDSSAGQLARKTEFRTAFLQAPEVTIKSCTSTDQLILGAYSNGAVVAWHVGHQEPIIGLKTHADGCNRIRWVDAPWGPGFFTAGGDGKLITWSFMYTAEEYDVWQPKLCAANQLGRVIGRSTQGDDDAHQPTSHAQQLVSDYTHHTGESDDEEDDLLGAFT